jgi:two-component system sensor histidine kinase HydH
MEPAQQAELPQAPNLSPWIVAILCAAATLSVDLAIRFIPPGREHWHYALDRFYYLPVIAAGLTLGRTGGFIAALAAGASYLSLTPESVSPNAIDLIDRVLESLMFVTVGVLTGVLAHREHSQRIKAQTAVTRLRSVYRELEENIDHVKRAARMSALGHLSAGLAHEIRNPLSSIEGAASIVGAEPANATRRAEFLNIIQAECRRLNRLVTNFLEFARPRSPELRPAAIPDLLRSVILLVSQTAGRSGITIREDFAPQIPPCLCDAEQVRQAVLNLMLNAVQAMPGGGEIVVGASFAAGRVTIRVRDHGGGVPLDNIDSIYDPFFTTKSDGTGLGLAVTYQIASQHGGELFLEENSSDGACFALSIECPAPDRLL